MSDEKRKLNEKRVQDFVDEAMARTAATGIGLVFRLGGTMEQAATSTMARNGTNH